MLDRRRRRTSPSARRLATLVVVVLAAIAFIPSPAAATTTSIYGYTTSTSWYHYSVTRFSTGIQSTFKPTNKLSQGGYGYLGLQERDPNGGWSSIAVSWSVNDFSQKDLAHMGYGTAFNLSACCYSTSGQDDYWAGTLTY